MATINVRIDDETKTEAEKVLKELGISASSAITMFYRQIIREGALPFTPSLNRKMKYDYLNQTTKNAIRESRTNMLSDDVQGYHSVRKMIDDILTEEDD